MFFYCQQAMSSDAAQAVIAAATLFGTSVEKIAGLINTDRNVSIQITNNSDKYILENPR